jgi:hypothetical protein
MKRTPSIARGLALMLLAGLYAGCASIESRPPVTTEQVVQMSKAGVPAADIVQKMRDAGTIYRLSGSQLARLKSEGVHDDVLDYMQETNLAAARARGAAEYGSYWGGAWAWGPYPYAPYPYGYWGPGYWRPYWGPYYRYPPHRYHRPRPAPPAAQPSSPPPAAQAPAPSAAAPAPAPARRPPAHQQQRN